MNIAQATTSGTRIGRRAESDFAAGLFQRNNDNDVSGAEAGKNLLGRRVYLSPFSGEGMTFRIDARRGGRGCGPALLSGLLALTACTSTPTVVESSATAVTVRYDGIANDLDDATEVARKACAARGKTAQLRNASNQGLGEHYGHFNCI